MDEPLNQQKLFKRTMIVVLLSQLFGGAGLAAGVTVGALLAADMLGTESYAGLPSALLTLGSALAAFLIGRFTQRFGRRPGLVTGFLAGGIGAIGVILAAVYENVILLFLSLFIYGAGTATNLLARYAGTDLAKPNQRATAISMAMVSTTFGAVAGPNLVDVMGRFAESIGIPALAGPFLLGAAAFILAGLIVFILLRPDPFFAARSIAEQQKNAGEGLGQGILATVNKRGIAAGACVMLLTQMVMVAIMTMTPVHMKHHGHGLTEVGVVIGIHVGAMFLPSLVTGMLIDKIGRMRMAIASGIVLLLAGLLAAYGSGDSMPILITALALLGLGWNLGLISGTTLIVDATPLSARARTQGNVDVLVALAGASGGALSGVIVDYSSYAALSLAGGLLSLLLIPVLLWSNAKPRTETNGQRSIET
ncbi:MFS transporter [Paenibacillus sp. LHD-117]|uniref:MFS transporter n=1 Tax=Paenibacillus sp. LHD-117 TaxID=3071412 RepID=UPI0027E0D5D2|nr:MFS transporter [Paenibacillus sp. LHD-117]MDQ6421733.1 MFS transporter [Paenibacillus sp. LHD-117]